MRSRSKAAGETSDGQMSDGVSCSAGKKDLRPATELQERSWWLVPGSWADGGFLTIRALMTLPCTPSFRAVVRAEMMVFIKTVCEKESRNLTDQ